MWRAGVLRESKHLSCFRTELRKVGMGGEPQPFPVLSMHRHDVRGKVVNWRMQRRARTKGHRLERTSPWVSSVRGCLVPRRHGGWGWPSVDLLTPF